MTQKDTYEQYGIKQYEYTCERIGEWPCRTCSALEGKVFDVADMESGVNANPMHPNCRCSTMHYSDYDVQEKEFLAKDFSIERAKIEAGKTSDVKEKPKQNESIVSNAIRT